jgi:uncharacterized protein YecE (DUF72 family)
MERWAAYVDEWRRDGSDVYIYFDNDAKVHAPHDAKRLIQAVQALGLH